ncbi:siroheme synthase CysG [Pseudahrensia aquimaris]|uniref:Siroheme synthase CysG n=1 Tax=Pseudahrensia aquimaris TaxID=744461 RepID=A0ABW3FB34_9HYPH
MKYYPAFLKLEGEKVVFSGAGDHAAAKIKLLLKTEADILVVGEDPSDTVLAWAKDGRLTLAQREIQICDAFGARLVYGANDEPEADARAVAFGKKAGALTNIVDNLEASEFLTPAIVDRDPVVIAIGTEGTAPVLARKVKSEIEEMLPTSTGTLALIANSFRPMATRLKSSTERRAFWKRFFFADGPKALAEGGTEAVENTLLTLYNDAQSDMPKTGHADLIGTGPGDPELLTLKARRKLHEADVVLHDRLVTPEILELARREATVICVGKQGYGPSWKQEDINALLVEHVRKGHIVARLKSGDAAIFGRLDEEIDALEASNLSWEVVPGITSASAAAASIGASLTRRGRNSSLRFLTGRDVDGFAEHEWKALAKDGSTAAIYMGVNASRFLAGRLLMHGANAATPITIVENASRIDQRVIATTLANLTADIDSAMIEGPAIIFLGIAPRRINTATLAHATTLAATGA